MMDGILNVYKEQGFTSFDVVAKLRGILKQKKIGHTGTLDPMAEGVLLVCLGKATKLVDLLTEGDKIYRVRMKLGIETDTEDITGQVTASASEEILSSIRPETVWEVVRSCEGESMQIPPMYSAIKKDGKKLYEYARAGIEIEREARPITIFGVSNFLFEQGEYIFDVHCSKGTYIRSLCRDIGRKLGCYATMTGLTRLRVHDFSCKQALKLSEIERLGVDDLSSHILPVDALLTEYPIFSVCEEGKKYLKNGNKLSLRLLQGEKNDKGIAPRIRVYMDGEFVALYDYKKEEGIYKVFKMFL